MHKNNLLFRGNFNSVDVEDTLQPHVHKGNCNKLNINNWISNLPEGGVICEYVEVRFKNTRKDYFRNVNQLTLKVGDLVALEANPGHDIGIVSLTGDLVYHQMKKNNIDHQKTQLRKVYRKAKTSDLTKWQQAIELEHNTMLRSRKISEQLNLHMKIGDVEYQGDRTKAIFYYIADERVDFRQLIKKLADEFKIRIEMKQIGARQEAGRIGGIGSCGRELCCSTWITNFVSVTTNAARYQEVSLNPQKLAGQCGKLKCCLNYELECYLDALEGFPSKEVILETNTGRAFFQKSDIYRQLMWYSFDPQNMVNMTAVPVERVHEIIALNKKGIHVDELIETEENILHQSSDYANEVGQDSLTRFDDKKKPKRKHKRKKKSFSKRNNKK